MADSKNNSQELKEAIQGRNDLLRAILVCGAIVLFIRCYLFEPFKIPSSSMVPTLRIGDHLFVTKFDYGYFIPFTKIEIARWSQPKRGDVIVFVYPKDEALNYIKRVIAVPGDKVRIKNHDIWINDQQVPKEQMTAEQLQSLVPDAASVGGNFFAESLDGKEHAVRFLESYSMVVPTGEQEFIIPPDKFFVMGDNRDQSYDSRGWGLVPRENIKGKARIVFLSLEPASNWLSLSKLRWSRSMTLIK